MAFLLDYDWLFLSASDWLILLVLGWLFQADANNMLASGENNHSESEELPCP